MTDKPVITDAMVERAWAEFSPEKVGHVASMRLSPADIRRALTAALTEPEDRAENWIQTPCVEIAPGHFEITGYYTRPVERQRRKEAGRPDERRKAQRRSPQRLGEFVHYRAHWERRGDHGRSKPGRRKDDPK